MSSLDDQNDLNAAIRTIPDYPKPGIMFRDITTLLGNARAFRRAVDEMVQPWAGMKIDKVAGIEARGFIPVRKKGKLPWKTIGQDYELEYGTDRMEIHIDAVKPGEKVLIVDDLIATGGTAEAAAKLIRQAGGEVVGSAFIIDLPDLGGAKRLEKIGVPVRTLVAFEGH